MDALLRHWGWVISAGAGYFAFLLLGSTFFISTARAPRAWDVWAEDQVRARHDGSQEAARSELLAVGSGRLVSALLVFALIVATTHSPGRAEAVPAEARPSILVIVTDDQNWTNFTRELMPNVFVELVDQGVQFNRAYVTTSLCCPSRAQILTGLYEHHNGVDGNSVPLERPTIVEALDMIGYRTSLAGKYLNSWPCEPRPEFDQWVCAGEGQSSYSMVDPTLNVNGEWIAFDGYTSDILADYTVDFINDTPVGQSFFALYTPTSPHLPANDPRCADLPVQPHRPFSYDADTIAGGKPLYQQRGPLSTSEKESIDHAHALMTRAVPCLDGSIGTILSSLGSRAQDTLVFFLSDNGYLYGEHRRTSKGVAYEEAARVPFVVRYPPLVPASERFESDALVQNIDIAATIADVLGISWGADGESLLPLLSQAASSVREGALLEYCQAGSYPCSPPILPYSEPFPPSYNAVVTPTMKYVENLTGESELYDLTNDPNEMLNVAGEPLYEDVEDELAELLTSLRAAPLPDTTIVTGPQGEIHSRLPMFRFFSQSRFATYQCRLTENDIEGSWRACDQGSAIEGPLRDGDYLFEVGATNEKGQTDATPDSRSFSIHSTGPDVRVDSGPSPRTRDRYLSFSFSSQTPGVTFECRLHPYGDPGAWEVCDPSLGAAYGPLDDDLWAFQVRALDPLGMPSDPPAEWFVQVDNVGPVVRFLQAPPSNSRSDAATFRFRPDEVVRGGLTCRLDAGAWQDCSGGAYDLSSLAKGSHTVSIRGTDELGNTGKTNFRWTIDWTTPSVTIAGPSRYTRDRNATIQLSANESLDLKDPYSCALDGGNLVVGNYLDSGCEAETFISDLEDGLHTLDVVVNDLAGNLSAKVTWTWTVDTVAPVTSITQGPADPTPETWAMFKFSITDLTPVASTCSLDGARARRCRNEITYEGLALGAHIFKVTARDAAGNVGAAAVWTWNIVP